MIIEEKAKRYDEAIKVAKSNYETIVQMDNDCTFAKDGIVNTFHHMFPELKESEDEKIRKAIKLMYSFLPNNPKYIGGVPIKKIFAWLEKQGECHISHDDEIMIEQLTEYFTTGRGLQNTYETVVAWLNDVKEKLEKQGEPSIYDVPSRNIILAVWELGNNWKELTNGCISTEHGTQLEYIQKHWNESEYYLREKQGEQKSIDKIEPKLKIGDFIVNDYCMGRIVEITNDAYLLDTEQGIPFSCHSTRLWDITKDAEDGDVLYINNTMSESIMIYKSFNNGVINKYASYNKFGFEGENYLTLNDGYIIPATKKQRDLLFQKMKEAGYEWDAEKKELKKIESKKLDADKVIEWLKHCNITNCDMRTSIIPDSSPTSNPHRVRWFSEDFIDKFKKDFGL